LASASIFAGCFAWLGWQAWKSARQDRLKPGQEIALGGYGFRWLRLD